MATESHIARACRKSKVAGIARMALIAAAFLGGGAGVWAQDSAGGAPTDSANDTRTIRIGSSAPAAQPGATAEPGQRYAVIIGINEYKNPDLNLRFCTPDARLIYDLLTDETRGGVPKANTALLLDANATRSGIEDAFNTLVEKAKPEDSVFVFYAGHGAPGDNKLFFWVNQDAQVERLRTTALSNNRIAEFLDDVRASRMAQFLDCCYSLGTAAGRQGGITMPAGDPFSGLVGQGRVTFTATSGREKAIELADRGHGAFTYYLGEALKGAGDGDNDGWVDIDEAWNYLNRRVTDAAKAQNNPQTPFRYGVSSHGFRIARVPGGPKPNPTPVPPAATTVALPPEATAPAPAVDVEGGLATLLAEGRITRAEYDESLRLLASKNPLHAGFRKAAAQFVAGSRDWKSFVAARAAAPTPAPTAPPTPSPTAPPTATPVPTASPSPTPTPVIVIPSPWSRLGDRERLLYLVKALKAYAADTGKLPTTAPGWHRALVEDNGTPGWRGPYLRIAAAYEPVDRYNNTLVFSRTDVARPGRPTVTKFRVISSGPNGINDNGLNDDLSSEDRAELR